MSARRARRTAAPALAGASLVCDYVGDLDVVASFEAATDGEDYIEGDAGNDVIFGGLGQDDIVGGSSSFFGLNAVNDALAGAATAGADLRPDGADLIFGGAGGRIGRNDDSHLGGADVDHARDADTIAGDNATHRADRRHGRRRSAADGGPKQVRHVRLRRPTAPRKLVVRGVVLLDYTAGGPDVDPQAFGLVAGGGPCGGAAASGSCSTPLASCAGSASRYVDVGGADELHGESGDDSVYGGCGNDVLFGDGQDDDLIGGWGSDWISGGTGLDGVLGDDGRIFTSRNTGCAVASGAVCTQYAEALFGVFALRTVDPDVKTSQGDVLNEYIYTPGKVQQALINVVGELVKAVDITPYNLGPNVDGRGHLVLDLPLYDANNSDDVVFGGWDDDFLHGASGDDAIGGGEALAVSFVQHFNASGVSDGLIRSDWTRPYNAGNLLLFGADSDPWNSPKPTQQRLGEFYLYDEYDPRRAILFDPSGAKWACAAFSNSGKDCVSEPPRPSARFVLDLTADEGRTVVGCNAYANNGDCIATGPAFSDGDDVLFGDLGNDWLVGGGGRDDLYGGWGNDLLDADDVSTTNGSRNDLPDTHAFYEDRAYGGAGLDILIGNTGGDRLIDWVGEFNSYLVPFSPFGIATVSRQVSPFLPEFLYALSASDGADPTRDSDTGSDVTRPGRNGEFEGELGLITQKDHGYWQQQTGGPTDPQPGNVPGGRRDTLRGADFNNGSMRAFAPDSGSWDVSRRHAERVGRVAGSGRRGGVPRR